MVTLNSCLFSTLSSRLEKRGKDLPQTSKGSSEEKRNLCELTRTYSTSGTHAGKVHERQTFNYVTSMYVCVMYGSTFFQYNWHSVQWLYTYRSVGIKTIIHLFNKSVPE